MPKGIFWVRYHLFQTRLKTTAVHGGVTITPHKRVPITPITRKFWENAETVSKFFEKCAKSWKKSEKVDFNEGEKSASFTCIAFIAPLFGAQ